MNIAMMTTWNSACGIAEYSANLVKEYLKMEEVNNVLLLTNKPQVGLEQHARLKVSQIFGVHWWGEDPTFKVEKGWEALNVFERMYGPIDVVHVQYQSSLYQAPQFNEFIAGIQGHPKKAITVHDSSKNPKHDLTVFDFYLMHQRVMPVPRGKEKGMHCWTFPTIEIKPRVFSFGMGRNDYHFLQEVCDELGFEFDSHDSRKSGWLTESALFDRMKKADVIVLWYNSVAITGQSAAMITAISSHRPVIVNNIEWFRDSPSFVHKVNDREQLKNKLNEVLNTRFINACSFNNLAAKHMGVYSGRY